MMKGGAAAAQFQSRLGGVTLEDRHKTNER